MSIEENKNIVRRYQEIHNNNRQIAILESISLLMDSLRNLNREFH